MVLFYVLGKCVTVQAAAAKPGQGFSISVSGRFVYTMSALAGRKIRQYQTWRSRTAGHLILEKPWPGFAAAACTVTKMHFGKMFPLKI